MKNSNEKNIFFYKKNKNIKKLKLNYNLRYLNRIITNKVNIKDKLFCLDKIFLSRYV